MTSVRQLLRMPAQLQRHSQTLRLKRALETVLLDSPISQVGRLPPEENPPFSQKGAST